MAKPINCITVKEARDIQNVWKNSRGKEIERAQKYEDTREFLYSVDELQEYLDYVREMSTKQGITNPGIRIYFAAYPGAASKKSYSTVFLSATNSVSSVSSEKSAEDTVENNYSIDPLNHSSGGVPPVDY
ncbi:hypothetical protein FK178_01365 [Antarcticibacterium arcticum]|uniref:Uncharacterized protein n=1 Tax=Antarcticibacterium arcticum TaxID=2585771 RepID=A0A5B8YL73_9FLAO|nr:hypothetical protein [Antarcticibacterium arcticum]QED36449.1 hypothetical protein FK178_01365 [Antarcticibacterium arcticum]